MRLLWLLLLAPSLHGQILRCGDVGCLTNPMTNAGDLIVGGVSGIATRLGASTGYLHWNGTNFIYDVPAAGPTQVTSDPAGSCTVGVPLEYNTTNGKLWGCEAGTWALINATACATPGTANAVAYYTGTGACTSPSNVLVDNTVGGSYVDLITGSAKGGSLTGKVRMQAPASGGGYALTPPTSISAGFVNTDSSGNLGVTGSTGSGSVVLAGGTTGSGSNVVFAGGPTLTGTTTVTNLNVTGSCTACSSPYAFTNTNHDVWVPNWGTFSGSTVTAYTAGDIVANNLYIPMSGITDIGTYFGTGTMTICVALYNAPATSLIAVAQFHQPSGGGTYYRLPWNTPGLSPTTIGGQDYTIAWMSDANPTVAIMDGGIKDVMNAGVGGSGNPRSYLSLSGSGHGGTCSATAASTVWPASLTQDTTSGSFLFPASFLR